MAGKSMGGKEDLKIENQNSSTVKVCSSESILSYQNGSSSNTETGDSGLIEATCDKLLGEKRGSDISYYTSQNVSSQCQDLIRKKLISDLSLEVFRTDLENKIIKMDPVEISEERLSLIQKLLVQISHLSDSEKLLLYLKLPSSTSNQADPLRQPLNPLGNRQEIQQTIVWIKTHLEEDRDISIPKQDVYGQYLKYCENLSMKPLSTADFGKVMKQVYPGVRPRRLGTRGNSRYCYSGMRNTFKLPTPSLPQLVHQNKITNGVIKNDSTCVVLENEKNKKLEKPKRKWKTSTCRNFKIPSTSRSSKTNLKDSSLKYSKRSKVENSTKENEIVKQGFSKSDDAKTVGYEGNCSQSYNSFDNISCKLGNDFGICFDYGDRVNETTNNIIKEKANLNLLNSTDFRKEDTGLNVKGSDEINTDKSNEVSLSEKIEKMSFESRKKDLSPIDRFPVETGKPVIANNDIKGNRNMEVKNFLGPRCELKLQKSKNRRSYSFSQSQRRIKKTYVPIQPKPVNNQKLTVHFEIGVNNKDKVSFCEESDSQEPEEEIIKYFKHLEENQLLGMVEESVIDNVVQMRNNSESMTKLHCSEVGRSQSCLENHSRSSKPVENAIEFELPQRSQSSVEFSAQQPVTRTKKETDKRDNVSHLRLLLEKTGNAKEENYLFEKRVPQSPSTSTKYFSFTPISPGPRSPLKTPKTSPFPNPKSSLPNDFLPPNDDNLNDFNIMETGILDGGHKMEKDLIQDGKYPRTMMSCRPRSNSSTNFYRTKRRNLSKVLSCDQVLTREPNFSQNRFDNSSINTSFPLPPLSGEIRQLLENQSKLQDIQSSSLRSQSVPLNRMISEGSWFSGNSFTQYLSGSKLASNDYGFVSESKNLEPFISNETMPDLSLEVFARDNQDISDQIFADNFDSGANNGSFNENNSLNVFTDKINENNVFPGSFSNDNIKTYLETFEGSMDKGNSLCKEKSRESDVKLFGDSLYESGNDNAKDPVITSFKPVMGEFSSCPNSPVLGFFTTKESVDNQLIEFLGLE